MKKSFAIYTIDEQIYTEENNGILKTIPEKVIKIHRVFGIPIKRVYAEKIKIYKLPSSATS